jgi:hypothetical protein
MFNMAQHPFINPRQAPFAVASCALGLGSCLGFTAPLALFSGIVAVIQIRNSEGELRGRFFAWIGIVTSISAITFYAMYFRAIPGLGWYHELVMTKNICGVPFRLGTPIAHCDDGPRDFFGDGYSADAYRIPSEVKLSTQMQKTFIPRVKGFGNDWCSVAWKSPIDHSDLAYVDFVLEHDAVRELATEAITLPTTRVAYFYKMYTGTDGTLRITDVTMYIIDIENKVFIVADRNI